MAGGFDGVALGAVGAGGLFLYAAISGRSVLGSVQALIKGGAPGSAPVANPITGTDSAQPSASAGAPVSSEAYVAGLGGDVSGQQALQSAAKAYGWDAGAQWQALSSVEMAEAGFNPQAKNPQSGALGLAQALGHGNASTAGTLGNEYGGFGLSDAQAKAANSGDAGAQSVWMVNYIAATYGNPVNAWAHEQTNRWY